MLADWPIDLIDYDKKISISRQKTSYGADLHDHKYLTIEYVVSGSSRQQISGNSYEFRRGDIAVFEPKWKHAFYAIGDLELINIVVHPELFQQINPTFEKEIENFSIMHIPPQDIGRFENIIYNMEKEYKEGGDMYVSILEGYLKVLSFMILRVVRDNNPRKISSINFIPIIEFIEKNLQTVTPNMVSRFIGYNYSYFSKLFKKRMGVNLSEYINIKRLEAAKELLTEKNETIENISYMVGFNQKSYFHRLFKQHYGITPDEYRRKK